MMKSEQDIRKMRDDMVAKGQEYLEQTFEKKTDRYQKKMREISQWVHLLNWVLNENKYDIDFEDEMKKKKGLK